MTKICNKKKENNEKIVEVRLVQRRWRDASAK